MNIGEYTLANNDKVERAINGTVLDRGMAKGGVGVDASDAEILAEYDRLGGLILKGTYKVKMGSFYDFKSKKPFANPKPVLVFQVNGETVEVDADEPLPLEVRAAEQANAKRVAKKSAAKKGKGKKASKPEEEEEESDDDEDGELA